MNYLIAGCVLTRLPAHLNSRIGELLPHRWADTMVEDFIQEPGSYSRWYNQHRIELSLGALGPMEYLQRSGITT